MQKQTPERIYHWLDSQLSIARHYGGCRFNGVEYVIAYNEEGQPLVRKDLLKKPKAATSDWSALLGRTDIGVGRAKNQ